MRKRRTLMEPHAKYTNTVSLGKRTIILLLCTFILCKGHSEIDALGKDRSEWDRFTDIFYVYYSEDRSRAKDLLQKAARDPRLKARALINLGVIDDWENRPSDAKDQYRRAYESGEPLALPYLLAAYDRTDRAKRLELLRSMKASDASRWACFELALVHCDAGETEAALKSLDLAAASGFDAPALLLSEPRLARLRASPRFREILAAAQRNVSGPSLATRAGQHEHALREQKSSGCSRGLYTIDELRKKGAVDDAAKRLASFAAPKTSFRDRSIALYWLARFRAQRGDLKGSKGLLSEFESQLRSGEPDPTGYKRIMSVIYPDLIRSDPVLRSLKD